MTPVEALAQELERAREAVLDRLQRYAGARCDRARRLAFEVARDEDAAPRLAERVELGEQEPREVDSLARTIGPGAGLGARDPRFALGPTQLGAAILAHEV